MITLKTQSSASTSKQRTLRIFAVGLTVRLVGALLIWLGDGHNDLLHKSLVVFGVILSIGGIGVLRYLLYRGLYRKKAEMSGILSPR
jgi:hypothetical protein